MNTDSNTEKYYYSKNGKQYGPYSLNELVKIIDADTLVWRKGIEWTNAGNLNEVAPFLGKKPSKKQAILKISAAIFVLLFVLGYFFWKGDQDTGGVSASTSSKDNLKDQIISKKVVRVGFEPDAPPVYYSENNSPTGFDYDLVKFISKEVFNDLEVVPVEAGYEELHDLLLKGEIDVIAGGHTPDNIRGIDFTRQYLQFGMSIITTNGKKRVYRNRGDISNDRIGVYDESAKEWVLEQFPDAKVIIIGDKENENTIESDWMKDLEVGNVDLVIYDYPFAVNEIGDYDNLTITSKNLNGKELNEYVLGIPSGNAQLLAEINAAIDKYMSSEFYSYSIEKYIPNPGGDDESISSTNFYTIQKGETLVKLAEKHLGDSDRWIEIWDANPQIASPSIIYIGQKLNKTNEWRN